MKITLQTVIDALGHCDDKQEKEILYRLNKLHESWAGICLGEIVKDHMESMEEEEEYNAEFDRERKLYLAARNR